MWILLVVPERSLLEETRRFLTGMGHRVVAAQDSAQAVAHLHLHPFDLVAADSRSARLPWAASLRNRWDTFDVPLCVFRTCSDLAEPLRRTLAENSRILPEKSSQGWPAPPDAQLASRLLSVFHACRRS